jgi:hypothetical protein
MDVKNSLTLTGISGTINKNRNAIVTNRSPRMGEVQLCSADNYQFPKNRWAVKNILSLFKDKFFILYLKAQEILYIIYK